MKLNRSLLKIIAGLSLLVCAGGCQSANNTSSLSTGNEEAEKPAETEPTAQPSENGDTMILFTSDVHGGVDKGFGFVGLQQIRQTLEENGTRTLLVDNGDMLQGEFISSMSEGETLISLMNEMKYDLAVPGNHEFDYGADHFIELTKQADFPYISCNIYKNGERVFDPYIIKEVNGIKIGFVGVTAPMTITVSTPALFQDENGNFIYDFLYSKDGKTLFETIQKSVDEVREKGADVVILMGHVGNEEAIYPMNFAGIIENTDGIDIMIDGHSHDKETVTMNNKNGDPVTRIASGTKLEAIGWIKVAKEDKAVSGGIYTWGSSVSAADLFGLENNMNAPIDASLQEVETMMQKEVGKTDFELTIYEPDETTEDRQRAVRAAETNLGDLLCDALRDKYDTDAAVIGGGGIRSSIPAGPITYDSIFTVEPFGDEAIVCEISGQQLLDMLEWGSRGYPDEFGGFLQVSGITYEIHKSVPSSCSVTADGFFASVDGEYRVKNVKVNGEDLDLNRKYTLAGPDYTLVQHGNGYNMISEEEVTKATGELFTDIFIGYIRDTMKGKVSDDYSDPAGQGRIVIVD